MWPWLGCTLQESDSLSWPLVGLWQLVVVLS